MIIIPAIDIIDGKTVRLEQGNFSSKKIYNEDPLETAKEFEDAGLSRIHLVDLDGARMGEVRNWKVLERIAAKTGLVIDFGGGIKTLKDVSIVFDSGASIATVGSIAVTGEEELMKWIGFYGTDKFLLGMDVKDEKIVIDGWQQETEIMIYELIEKYFGQGIRQVFCTDIKKDGKLEGPAFELYKKIIEKFPDLQMIASGGVSSMGDIESLMKLGCHGVILGKAIYEGRIALKELSAINAD